MKAISSITEEIAAILVNKQIWSLSEMDGITFTTGPHLVLSVRQFLPAGSPSKPGYPTRDQSLVDLMCDDGRRVFAVANIWSRNPEKASDPW